MGMVDSLLKTKHGWWRALGRRRTAVPAVGSGLSEILSRACRRARRAPESQPACHISLCAPQRFDYPCARSTNRQGRPIMPTYWMITDRNVEANRLGQNQAAPTYWVSDGDASLDLLTSWTNVSADQFKTLLLAAAAQFPLI